MNSYYQKLVEEECRHIRETVKIKVLTGAEAVADSDRVNRERQRRKMMFKDAVTVNPETGRATDMPAFIKGAHDIVDIPCSMRPLDDALFEIVELAKVKDYPEEDRQTIIDTFEWLRMNGRLDGCSDNQLYRAAHTLRRASEYAKHVSFSISAYA